jgi:nicotinamidase-related amidase
MGKGVKLLLSLRRQELTRDARGRNCWKPVVARKEVPAANAVLVICDMWDNHWCRGAAERVDELAPRMNEVVSAARDKGVFVIHAPSETMAFYEGAPGRARIAGMPQVEPPIELAVAAPPLPFETPQGGCDTGECYESPAWTRQHPAIEIAQDRDGISDNGREVYSAIHQRGARQLVIMGVHTNYCVLNRSFAIKQMVKWGVDVALVRDMTDCMYNPAMPPYVSHEEGTRLVVEYIEKFWCPTFASADLF